MNQKIKLIWDFRGPDALQIAKHHVIHLEEYTAAHQLENNATGVEKKSDLYSIAFLIVSKDITSVSGSISAHLIFPPNRAYDIAVAHQV